MADKTRKGSGVGYCRPPLATRFRPGTSGNPAGRARGLKSVARQISDVLTQKITVTRNNRPVRLTLQEVMFSSIAAKAAKGDLKCVAFLLTLQDRFRDSAATTLTPEVLSDTDQAIIAEFLRGQAGSRIPAPDGRSPDTAASLSGANTGATPDTDAAPLPVPPSAAGMTGAIATSPPAPPSGAPDAQSLQAEVQGPTVLVAAPRPVAMMPADRRDRA